MSVSGALDGLLLGWLLLAWGAQAVIPWRLAGLAPTLRKRGALALLPLLVTGVLAAFLMIQGHPDAALAQALYPPGASILGRALAVLFTATALAGALLATGWRSLEAVGWRLAALFGAALLLAATWAAELLRTGDGPASAPAAFIVLTLLRALIALGAAEALAPGPPRLAVAAGLALPVYALLLPAPLARALALHGQWLTLAAAALLLAAARWLPPALRRPALLAGALLAGLFLGQAVRVSETLAVPPLPPMPSLGPGR
jgi:hypothetical protein